MPIFGNSPVTLDCWLDWTLGLATSIIFFMSYIITNLLFRPTFYAGNSKSKRLLEKLPAYDGCWRIDEKRNGLGTPRTDLGLDYEDVEFPCGPTCLPGNSTLRGWYVPSPSGDKELCVVVCHGGGRDRRQHLRHVPILRESGAAVLLFDKQEHGLSDGCQRGIGWFTYEGSDVYAAVRYMKLVRGYKRVVAMGSSFGGVGAITAAGYFDKAGEEQMIDGVIAENPPHSRLRFVRELCHKHGDQLFLPVILRELCGLVACLLIILRRLDPFTPNPIDVIKNVSPRPILIMHGTADTIVPVEHGIDLYEAALEPKDCLWVPDCEHTLVFNADPVGWAMKTTRLLNEVKKSKGGMPRPL